MKSISVVLRFLFLVYFSCSLFSCSLRADDSDALDSAELFRTEIASLLKENCVRCHNANEAQGDVDLSGARAALSRESDPIVVRHKATESRLLEVVLGDKPEMPKAGKPLTAKQVELLRKWIDRGAEWPEELVLKSDPLDWWSLKPLARPELPTLAPADQVWTRNAIDSFVMSKLRAMQMSPAIESDRRTYIRRVTYDLTGLPPTVEQVADFEQDSRPNAYESLVNRLLDSPQYGERWAQHWLDVAHYGDTHGYDKDKVRPNAWPYRDYVIRAFNGDKPYSQFVQEQLAGDHFYPDTQDGVTGLGFLAAGPFDFVGQIEVRDGTLEKLRVRNIDRDDMVSVATNTFTSQTAQCARCHDHKFDPISQEDYYSLQSVFACIDRADRAFDADPQVGQKRKELSLQLEKLAARKSSIDASIKAKGGVELEQLTQQISQLTKAATESRRPEYGYHSEIAPKDDVPKWVQVDLGKTHSIAGLTLVAANDDFAGIGAGFGFPVRYKIESSDKAEFGSPNLLVDQTRADVSNPGSVPVKQKVEHVDARFIRVTATKLAHRQNDYIFAIAELAVLGSDGKNLAAGASVTALDSIEAPVRWAKANLVDGISPVASTKEGAESIAALQDKRESLLRKIMDAGVTTELGAIESKIQSLTAELKSLPAQQQVYAANSDFLPQGNFTATQGVPRPIFLLERGNEQKPKQAVAPGAINCVSDLKARFELPPTATDRERRAALANWIVSPKNPLTWRSIVNRVWSYHFGRGIVETTNDFGRMGAVPSHPELLDWMAAEFRDGRQSIKDLHRLIVLSATYRQSSTNNPSNATIDSENRYLWRMNRRRLEAEAIRDSVLAISGKLRFEMGGPSFRPFRFEDDHSPRYLYEEFDPNDVASHRRSIYRMIVRSVPDPLMSSLDCADPSMSVDRRNETLTALQSLSLLNNVFVVHMSQTFADKIAQSTQDRKEQIQGVYRTALQRDPTKEEMAILLPIMEHHGLPNICRLVFNSNEFVFVD